jgi:hypothetical protein
VFSIFFVLDFLDYKSFMYLDKDSFGGGIEPKTSCDLYCTSDCFSCAIVDLAINQSPRGLSFDIFDKFTQQEYACIDIICILHVHSNTYITAKLGIINSPFYRFLSRFISKYFINLSDGQSCCPSEQ